MIQQIGFKRIPGQGSGDSHGKADEQQALTHDSNLADPMIGRKQRRSEDRPNLVS